MPEIIDCSKVSQALAKAIAYKQCGNNEQAALWAVRLIQLLQCADILKPEATELKQIQLTF